MRSNLSSKILVAVLPMLYVMELNKTADSRYEITGGIEGIAVKDILKALGKEYELVIPADGESGRKKFNGHWTGLIGMAARGEADLAFGGLGFTSERLKVVDFTKPLVTGSLTFAIGRAEKFRPKNPFFYPFHGPVWGYFFFTFFALTAAMWLIFKKKHSIERIVFELCGIILRQSFTLDVISWKSKFFMVAIFLYGLVMTSGYLGILLSFMTVPMQGNTVETFKQLSDAVGKGTHRCWVLKNTPIVPFLISTKEKHLQLLGKEIYRNKWFVDREDMNAINITSPYDAYIAVNVMLDVVFSEHKSKYLVSEDSVGWLAYGVAMNRKFCCKKKLNDIITRIWESGMYNQYIMEKASMNWLRYKEVKGEEEEHTITIEDISGALIILCAGWAISMLTLLAEILIFKYA